MTAAAFPLAWHHFDEASKRQVEIASRWSRVLATEPVEERTLLEPDGRGSVSAVFAWPDGEQSALTATFRALVKELWAALDSLVQESFDSLSVLNRPRDFTSPRFFPVADSQDTFMSFLEQSCLDGILTRQFQMVRDVQPFIPDSGDARFDALRSAIRQLLAWETALEAGETVSAWATPVSPQVSAEPPAEVADLVPSPPGELLGQRVLAQFRVDKYGPDAAVSSMSGTYVDVCFVPGFEPTDTEDTFYGRLKNVIFSLKLFALAFASFADQVEGSRRIRLGDRTSESAWADASKSVRRWSAEDLAMVKESETGYGIVEDPETLTLVVSTPEGVFERVIPRATPLRPFDRPGRATEVAIKDAAATWGLPDFVFSPVVERKGSGVREVGDGLLIAGTLGAIVQAKAREVEPGDVDGERRWVTKQIKKGTSQAGGTARRLTEGITTMKNGRGRSVPIDGATVKWVGVVVIEHVDPPTEVMPDFAGAKVPMVALYRRDWEFLFEQLRSTHAVISYLHRVSDDPESLGSEPGRYYELAAADLKALPGPIDPALVGVGTLRSVPTLPTAPAGADDDEAHALVRMILEDLAAIEIEPERLVARQDCLASLDSLPVAHRTELGQFLLGAFAEFSELAGNTTMWQFRTYLAGAGTDQLAFGACSQLDDVTRAAFQAWLQLRHHDRGTRVGTFDTLRSIGVLLTPRAEGPRRWDTTMLVLEGDPELSTEDLVHFRELWDRDHVGGATDLA